jgi:PAS domain S-box-containing protein
LKSLSGSSTAIRYAVAALAVTTAVVVRMALEPTLAGRLPFITLFAAVVISSWFGGLGPGLAATAGCLLAADFFWLAPRYSLYASGAADVFGLAMFGIIGVAISVLQEMSQRSAAAVIESQERLNLTMASIGDGVIVADAHDRITTLNAVAETLTGWTDAAAIGRPLDEVCVAVDEGTRELQPPSEWRRTPLTLVARDQRRTPVEISLTAMRAGSRMRGKLVVFRDISARHEAERIRRDEDRATRMLAAIVESSDDAIVSKNLESTILSWNAGAERMFGYSAAEAVGRSVRLIIPDDRMGEEDEVLRRLRRGERVEHFETIRKRKDGREIQVSLTISPIHDRSGVVVGASKIARDITALKETEAERVRLLKENAAVTEQLNRVGAVVASDLDRDAIAQAVTDAATELTAAEVGAFFYDVTDVAGESDTRYTVTGVPREHLANVPAPGDAEGFESTFRAIVSVGAPIRSFLAVPVVGRSGQTLGKLFFAHSAAGRFTERQQRLAIGVASWASVALENAAMYGDARETSRLKDYFLATLSHELRTPLNAILGYARMLRSGMVAADKQSRAVQVIERNATALTQIVEDVLDVSRIVSGKLRLNLQSVELPDILRTAVDAITPTAEAKGVRVGTTLDPDASPITGDPERLQQIFWNLLSNAVKFTGRGGRVDIRLGRAGGHAEIAITDTGIGIARDFLPHIFERFRQADASFSRERGGLGLGLSISRQLAEMHGGTLQASSEGLGHGSTFRLRLPLVEALADLPGQWSNVPPAEASTRALPDLSGLRVLTIDDEADARQLIVEILESAGASVIAARSSMEALELLEHDRPDVIVADLGMPHIDGLEFIHRVRSHPDVRVRELPAAALTAFARSEDRRAALRAGFQRHLAKPIDPAELVLLIATLARHVGARD